MERYALEVGWEWGGAQTPAAARPQVELVRGPVEAIIRFDAPFHGDPAPDAPRGPLDGLWNFEVVELFVAYGPDQYIECELGPHGHWVSLAFDGVRNAVACPLPLRAWAKIEGHRWWGELRLPAAAVPPPRALNACAIHGGAEARRYCSTVALPGKTPEFHQPQHFADAASVRQC